MSEQEVPTVYELMKVMAFTEEDLLANRNGDLSSLQKEELSRLQQRNLWVGGSLFIGLVVVATVLLFMGQQNNSTILTLVGTVIVVINALMVGIFGRQWMRVSADLRGGQVEEIKGVLERIVRPTGRIHNYYLRVEGIEFPVKKEVFILFRHELVYSIYRTRHSRVMLTAEQTT